jgi:ribosomal protein S18 acetylase RimI-like enzyme
MDIQSPERVKNIRPLRSRDDLLAVADLVELCFADSMDADGRDYLRHIRRIARNHSFYSPGGNLAPGGRLPVQGYVWEEDDRIVGNLTLIPFIQRSARIYLIANVAVHPHYRRRGIARELTLKGLAHAWAHGARSVWLHVREDNQPAQDLYLSIGFVERIRRTTWLWEPPGSAKKVARPENMRVGSLRGREWPLVSAWLDQTYPPEVTWNFRFEKDKFRPGIIHEFWRFLKDQRLVHLGGYLDDRLIGSIAWEPTNLYADMLWIACDPQYEEDAITLLLDQVRPWLPEMRPLSVNYPSGRAESAFIECDFSKQNTLIWMEHPYSYQKGGERT